MSNFNSIFNNSYTKYGSGQDSKSINAYPDTPPLDLSDYDFDNLNVSGDVEVGGKIVSTEVDPGILGPYTQDGNVNFANNTITNANVQNGRVNNVTITNSKGYFTYLYSGKPGVGYEAKFYGSDGTTSFDFNGLQNYLSIQGTTILDSPTPYHTNSVLQIAPARTTTSTNSVVYSIIGNTVTGDFTAGGILPGDYLVLSDGTNIKIASLSSSGTVLYGSGLDAQRPNINLSYTDHNAGWYFDNQGNLLAEGYGYLQLPKADPTNDFSYSTNLGLIRYNQNNSQFEVYGVNGWVPLAQNGYVTNKDFNTGMVVESDPENPGLDRVRFFQKDQNDLTINGLGQVSIGTATSPPSTNVSFYVAGNSQIDGTITGQALQISSYASISTLSVQTDAYIGGSGIFSSNLSVLGDSNIAGGLNVGSNMTISGTLTVNQQLKVYGDTDFFGNLHVHGNIISDGTTTTTVQVVTSLSSILGMGYFGSNVVISGDASLTSSLTVGGVGSFASSVYGSYLSANIGSFTQALSAGSIVSDNVSTTNLTAIQSSLTQLTASTGTFGSLSGTLASFNTLTTDAASITSLTASAGSFTVLTTDTLSAVQTSLGQLTASTATFGSLSGTLASFSTLNAIQSSLSQLSASTATFGSLSGTLATFSTLTTGAASISSLTVSTGSFSVLMSTTLSAIQSSLVQLSASTATFGSLSGTLASFNTLTTSGILTASQANVNYANISTLSVSTGSVTNLNTDKLTSGTIYATLTQSNVLVSSTFSAANATVASLTSTSIAAVYGSFGSNLSSSYIFANTLEYRLRHHQECHDHRNIECTGSADGTDRVSELGFVQRAERVRIDVFRSTRRRTG